ncbi:bone morphogenetic protein 1-like [Ruditapes philippinarum]|uniref:bone morphogenetic protein 1-like n=1 Tax=Ruditapes philippinarum TaxID=129788 RepID=UPI00295A9C29|nr:bone morphogenetic protein 1-like [Ruditapes philippinarum]
MFKFVCLLLGIAAANATNTKRAYTCGSNDYFTQNNGEIASHAGFDAGHNYGKNLNCIWRIEAPDGMNVELVAKAFNIEDDPACAFDYLEIFDGNSTQSPSLGKYCGGIFNPISSTQRFLTMQLITDDSTQLQGFKLFYNFTTQVIHSCHHTQFECANGKCIDMSYRCDNDDDCGDDSDEQGCTGGSNTGCAADEWRCPDRTCISRDWLCDGDDDCNDNSDELPTNCVGTASSNCGNQNISGSAGTITSPGFPSSYPSDTHCTYIVLAPPGTKSIAFKFDDQFHIEPDTTCDFDFVKISGDGMASSHGPFCGNVSPGQLTVPGDHAYVTFTSDDSDEYTGFRLDWKAIQ